MLGNPSCKHAYRESLHYSLGNKMQVWDNQQATSWFTGILEGEGWFQKGYGNSKCQGRRNYIRIGIQCNDKDIINCCTSFYQANQILHTAFEKKVGKKIGYGLYCTMQDCKILYSKIQSKLQCRRNEFQKLIGASETLCNLSIDLHWLIGIWEAEGSFYFVKYNEIVQPRIAMCNSNNLILEKIKLNLKALDFGFHLSDYKPETTKAYTQIAISGMLRCRRFLIAMRNQWRSNRNLKRSELMLKYIDSRLSISQNRPLTEQQWSMYNQMKQLNT